MAKTQNNSPESQEQSPQNPGWIGIPTPSGLLCEMVSLDFIGRRVDRPLPWIAARLEEMQEPIAFRLDETSYYQISAIGRIKKTSDDWAEKIRLAKREAVAMGE